VAAQRILVITGGEFLGTQTISGITTPAVVADCSVGFAGWGIGAADRSAPNPGLRNVDNRADQQGAWRIA
jgi:hypothetical protein